MNRASSPLELDPNSDVTIVLSTTPKVASAPTTVKVSSKCLSLASSVFSTMLRPNSSFLEGSQLKKTGHLELTLDDNPEAMLIILKSLHHRNDEILRYLDVAVLYEIALIADKYDLYSFLVPWAEIWITQHRVRHFFGHRYVSAELWLCITWVLRDNVVFESISKQLILETTAAYEELITQEGKIVGEGVPDCIIDAIKKQRRTHFTTLVTGVWKEIDRYKDARSNDKYICALGASLQQAQCDSISLGAITGSLARANLLTSLYTGPQVDVLADAIKELKNINKLGGGLKFVSTAAYTTTYPTSVVQPTYRSHEHCGSHSQLIQLAESVEKSIEGLKLTGFLQKSKV